MGLRVYGFTGSHCLPLRCMLFYKLYAFFNALCPMHCALPTSTGIYKFVMSLQSFVRYATLLFLKTAKAHTASGYKQLTIRINIV